MIYVIAIGAFQAITAVALLWKNKLRSKADTLLILFLCCIATHLAIKFYIFSSVKDIHIRFQMNTFIGFCYGPLIYLYALQKKDSSFLPASRWYVFIPFILGAIGYFTVACVLSYSLPAGYAALNTYNNASFWLFIVVGVGFPVLAIKESKQLPIPEKTIISQISYILLSMQIVACLCRLLEVTHIMTGDYTILIRNIMYSALVIICVMIIRYKMEEKKEEEKPVVRKIHLSTEEHEVIIQTLETNLRKTKIFTDAELTLDKLAGTINISKYHLSEALNHYASKSFYQYINEMRIHHAMEQMQFICSKGLPVNVLTIAYDCGFKAKSSFNLYFKKISGLTPTEYLSLINEKPIHS
jgi:AraC-like DNA-binding protein